MYLLLYVYTVICLSLRLSAQSGVGAPDPTL